MMRLPSLSLMGAAFRSLLDHYLAAVEVRTAQLAAEDARASGKAWKRAAKIGPTMAG
jgi:hypothetical protein